MLTLGEDSLEVNLAKYLDKQDALYLETSSMIDAYHSIKQGTDVSGILSEEINGILEKLRIDNLVGQRVEVFELTEKIDAGGMGVVYKANRIDGHIDQTVAIKFVCPSLIQLTDTNFFKAEAQHLANLKHDNITKIFNFGITDSNLQYIIMEYIEGVPIDRYCEIQKLDLKARLQLFQKVCHAVHEAHRNMVIHADIKPTNILVNKHGEPKLMDFGIAQRLNQPKGNQRDELSTKTQYLRAVSHGFASPEQIKGEPLSGASDIYSAGKVLDLLTREITKSQCLISNWCKETVEKCLKEKPNLRISSFDQMANGIENLLNFYRPIWCEPSWINSVKAFVIRNSTFSASVLFTSILSIVFVLTLVQKNQALSEQNAVNQKVISFLSSLFKTKSEQAEDASIFNLLKQDEVAYGAYQSALVNTTNTPFLPLIFTNHSVKKNELIELKVALPSSSMDPYVYSVDGEGEVDKLGVFRAQFPSVGIKRVSILARNKAQDHQLDLNFIVRDNTRSPISFSDVLATDPNYGDIHYLALKGILIGRPQLRGQDRIFQPDQYVKQAEALKIILMSAHERKILTLEKSNVVYNNLVLFKSNGGIEDYSWAATFLDLASKLGIVDNAQEFNPKRLTSRLWMAKVLVNSLNLFDPEHLAPMNNGFTDEGNFRTEEDYSLAKTTAFYNLLGELGSAFLPETPMTRREVAVIAAKVLQLPVVNALTESQGKLLVSKTAPGANYLPNLQTPAYRRVGNAIIALDENHASRTKVEISRSQDNKIIVVMSNLESGVKNSLAIPAPTF